MSEYVLLIICTQERDAEQSSLDYIMVLYQEGAHESHENCVSGQLVPVQILTRHLPTISQNH